MRQRRSDMREKIQAVALELFAEQGYEKTSLREIADRLHVTKAALYYHFRTKEDIIVSLFDDAIASVDELIAWGREQPATPETRRELVRRYAAGVFAHAPMLMRFAQENQGTMRDLAIGEKLRDRMKTLADLMTDKKAPLTSQLKSALALFAVNASMFIFEDAQVTQEERRAAGIEVALELVSGS
jgi:AcrR family transcriptional regulator